MTFDTARALIESRLKDRLIVALEGGAASGKTTLAAQLAAHFHAPVIAMDDFFLPSSLRTPQRFAQVGGNIHYERFNEQVADAVRNRRPIQYDVFDCHAGIIRERILIPEEQPLVLVEGVYSLHPLFRDIYDLRIFLRTAPETQDARLRARGDWLYRRFQAEWLPLEKAYFDSEDWAALCDAVLDT